MAEGDAGPARSTESPDGVPYFWEPASIACTK